MVQYTNTESDHIGKHLEKFALPIQKKMKQISDAPYKDKYEYFFEKMGLLVKVIPSPPNIPPDCSIEFSRDIEWIGNHDDDDGVLHNGTLNITLLYSTLDDKAKFIQSTIKWVCDDDEDYLDEVIDDFFEDIQVKFIPWFHRVFIEGETDTST